MKNTLLAMACMLLTASALPAQLAVTTQGPVHHQGTGTIVIPAASVRNPEDLGRRMHTHFRILVPDGAPGKGAGFAAVSQPNSNTPVNGYIYETPQSLACIYGVAPAYTAGCNPASLANSTKATGGSKAIAIVDAYDYPTALADLSAFSTQFGLPAVSSSNFTVLGQDGSTTLPPVDPSCQVNYGWYCWEAEEALDIEMAHALAPGAHIYLIEANSSYNSDLFAAVQTAAIKVAAAGGGEVSMSWGGSEYNGEATYDSYMVKSNVVFFASTGDSAGTEYPSVSPNVVAVGGTTLMRNPWTLNLEAEVAWEDGGGGFSPYEPRPSYQAAVSYWGSNHRGVPDIAAVANPRTGVWVYDSFYTNDPSTSSPAPWNILGGTSVASPATAALVNNAGHFLASTPSELVKIYREARTTAYPSLIRDVQYGDCGFYDGWYAIAGWDPCTGYGAPRGRNGL